MKGFDTLQTPMHWLNCLHSKAPWRPVQWLYGTIDTRRGGRGAESGARSSKQRSLVRVAIISRGANIEGRRNRAGWMTVFHSTGRGAHARGFSCPIIISRRHITCERWCSCTLIKAPKRLQWRRPLVFANNNACSRTLCIAGATCRAF